MQTTPHAAAEPPGAMKGHTAAALGLALWWSTRKKCGLRRSFGFTLHTLQIHWPGTSVDVPPFLFAGVFGGGHRDLNRRPAVLPATVKGKNGSFTCQPV